MTYSNIGIANERAKNFLKMVMGEKKFNNFTKNGKIEIKSSKYTYILDKYGNVINKTTKQAYCITPGRNFYPLYDNIAIKYCWLKYGNNKVEEVANKKDLTYEIIEYIELINLFNRFKIIMIFAVNIMIIILIIVIFIMFVDR